MTYSIRFLRSAQRELAALPADVQRRIARKIDSLASNPRPPSIKKLHGDEGILRVRIGHYIVLYRVVDSVLEVLVVKIGHRREVYRRRR